MWKMRVKHALARAFLTAATVLCVAGPAQATVYTGVWDPAFGGIFPQLGWRGTAQFFIPDSCLSLPNGSYLNGSCGDQPMTVLSGEFSFYNLSSPAVTLETFRFGPGQAVTSTAYVYGMDVTNHQLSGADTAYFVGAVPSGASKPIAGNGNFQFLLAFSDDEARLFYTPTGSSPSDPKCYDGNVLITSRCGFNQVPAKVTFTTAVPEPETYALLLAGLAASGLALRRRRK